MKRALLTILLTAAASCAAWAATLTATGNGLWANSSTWGGSTPSNGDIIVIPAGITVTVDSNAALYTGVVIRVEGTLFFNVGKKIDIDRTSSLEVYPGGVVDGSNNGSKFRVIDNDGTTVVQEIYNGPGGAACTFCSPGTDQLQGPLICDESGCASAPSLPVELLYFRGAAENGGVELTWATASEENSSHFDVEYSSSGHDFTVLATVAGAGTTSEHVDYAYFHRSAWPQGYYRLTQHDLDGQSETFNVVHISGTVWQDARAALYPNPVQRQATLAVPSSWGENLRVLAYDLSGKQVTLPLQRTSMGMEVDTQALRPGQYVLLVQGAAHSQSITFQKY